MLTLEQIKDRIQTDLNQLAIDLGYVDNDGVPTIAFYGEVATYADYDWITSTKFVLDDDTLQYLPISPFALIRENSAPSAGELITERLDEFVLYFYVKTKDIPAITNILEEYINLENHENNLVEISGAKVLKRLSNFIIDDEELFGAPDGESRHQVSFAMGYDIFEGNILTSKDYKVTIDGEEVKYISFRFEKSNLVSPNTANKNTGTGVTGLGTDAALGRLHEFAIVFDLFIDRTSTAIKKILADADSYTTINKTYEIEITSLTDPVVFSFQRKMLANGFKISNTLPQISSIEVTMTPAYAKSKLKIGLVGDELVEIPIITYKFGHQAALKTAAYFDDNASKSKVIGLAKGLVVVVPVLQEVDIISEMVKETLSHVYTNIYTVEFEYLGTTVSWNFVITQSTLEGDDAAYDTLQLSFAEAR